MGGHTSALLKNVVAPIKWLWPFGSADEKHALALFNGGTPFVFKRRGSMYIDEDGDVAHEFYEEKIFGRAVLRAKMIRKTHHLTPQGEVDLPFPCLHCDLPVVMCEVALLR